MSRTTKLEITLIKKPEDFFDEMLKVIAEPDRLHDPGTKRTGIELLPIWIMERINQVRHESESMARAVRAMANNQDSSRVKELKVELKKSGASERVQDQVFLAFNVRRED